MNSSPGSVCTINPHRGRHSRVSVLAGWQSEGPHSGACSVHSPAPQDTGTEPGHSSTRGWDTARDELYRDLGGRELVGRNMHKGRKKQSGHTRSCWSIPSLPFWKEKQQKRLWQVLHHLQRFSGWAQEKRFGRYSSNKG